MSKLFVILILPLLIGCALFSAFAPPEISLHPDAPALVLEIKGDYARIAVYDSENNRLIVYGWVSLKDYKNWTLLRFDWEKFILEQKKKNGEAQ
jgi:hypothetical protein